MKRSISIHIGGFHASREPTVIETLLGSCVAVCLYDSVARIGGMNHILLPGKADLKHFDNVARYAINAMELLINRIMTPRGQKTRLDSKGFRRGECSSGCLFRERDGRQKLRVCHRVPSNGSHLHSQPGCWAGMTPERSTSTRIAVKSS